MRTLPRSAVQVRATPDGVLTYLVDLPPEDLPPVRGRDLEAAWAAAGELARAARRGPSRVFRFRGRGGESVDLALTDPDACCWARAVDQTVGMGHSYGLSLCLRLLALVELLGRAAWAGGRAAIGGGPHPALLSAAGAVPLTPDLRLDEPGLRARLSHLPRFGGTSPSGTHA
ncbi:MAG: hypothetical protein ACRYG6_05395 [Janthinobacterium lividum]